MSRLAKHGHETTGIRGFRPGSGRACRLAGGLALALALVPAAQAQTSGIYINNDVLNSLGPGPDAPAPAPLAPAAPPTLLTPNSGMTYQAPALTFPPAGQSNNGLSFQTYGSGNYVVTRPGTLLFPPLEAPTSTLAPGFQDNHAARTEAMNNAFASGPEPSSQLLIPLQNDTAGDDSVVVFMENLPAADGAAGDAPRLTLRNPAAAPGPAPRKPEVSPEMLAETGATAIDDAGPGLAPEFQASAAEAPAPEAPASEAPAPEASAKVEAPMAESAPAAPAGEAAAAPAPMTQVATSTAAPQSSATVAAPMAAPSPAPAAAPVSLLPDSATAPVETTELASPAASQPAAAQPATVQTASLNVGPVGDMSVLFDGDSAELTENVQAELRSLASSMQASEDRHIQVLGFASSEGGSEDLARKLALSRALKVRTFLIDAGVASTRIQVRSLGDKSEGGPANRVDIRTIDS